MICEPCRLCGPGEPNPRCRLCQGTGFGPLSEKQEREMRIHALQTLATRGDVGAMAELARENILWPLPKEENDPS